MNAIETETVGLAGQAFRVTIDPDGDAPNPLDDRSELGSILSLNRKHRNFYPAGVEAAIESNPGAIPLGPLGYLILGDPLSESIIRERR